MILADQLNSAIDELRVQMLGTEVLFGFQLESTFRNGFEELSPLARQIDVVALLGIVLTLAALIGAPAQHRLIEQGDASLRLLAMTRRLAGAALFFLAITLGCDGFIVTQHFLGTGFALGAGIGVFSGALLCWFLLGWLFKRANQRANELPAYEKSSLHQKIEQMLHEAWVVLPGATGIFGFQLIITMSPAFKALAQYLKMCHFVALALIALTLILLLTPAAIHRAAFAGTDDPKSHSIGSFFVSLAMAPLAAGISIDAYLAFGRMIGFSFLAGALAASVLGILILAWYAVPLWIRRRPHGLPTEPYESKARLHQLR